jgi:hypothetical protein
MGDRHSSLKPAQAVEQLHRRSGTRRSMTHEEDPAPQPTVHIAFCPKVCLDQLISFRIRTPIMMQLATSAIGGQA